VFQAPKVNRKLIGMSKSLKRMKKLLHLPEQASLLVVTIPTEMAFQETLDLVAACRKMEIYVKCIFINLATPTGDCVTCSSLSRAEKAMFSRYKEAFEKIPQTIVFRDGDLLGPVKLETLGSAIYLGPETTPVLGVKS
jgi:arsenite-transporting ATPase